MTANLSTKCTHRGDLFPSAEIRIMSQLIDAKPNYALSNMWSSVYLDIKSYDRACHYYLQHTSLIRRAVLLVKVITLRYFLRERLRSAFHGVSINIPFPSQLEGGCPCRFKNGHSKVLSSS